VWTTITAIAGLVFGFTGFLISILNYRRDRPKIIVRLRWDSVFKDKEGHQIQLGEIYIANAGRRPVYITAAGIQADYPLSPHVIRRHFPGAEHGRKLAEGDPPIRLIIPDSREMAGVLIEKAAQWREMRAFVEDSTGRRYLSKVTWLRPCWAVGDRKAAKYEQNISWFFECKVEQYEAEAKLASGEIDVYGILGEHAYEFRAPVHREDSHPWPPHRYRVQEHGEDAPGRDA
jgi:hypothetical protein